MTIAASYFDALPGSDRSQASAEAARRHATQAVTTYRKQLESLGGTRALPLADELIGAVRKQVLAEVAIRAHDAAVVAAESLIVVTDGTDDSRAAFEASFAPGKANWADLQLSETRQQEPFRSTRAARLERLAESIAPLYETGDTESAKYATWALVAEALLWAAIDPPAVAPAHSEPQAPTRMKKR